MSTSLVNALAVIMGAIFIVLLLVLYIRSRRGDQRVINTINQMLLPLLSVLVVSLNFIFIAHRSTESCVGIFNTVFYAGVIAAILLILGGCVRFFVSRQRDKRSITHAVLFSAMIVTIVFITTYVSGCF